jgi:hypothetical protein
VNTGMNGAVVARIRFIDDCLAKRLPEGLKLKPSSSTGDFRT